MRELGLKHKIIVLVLLVLVPAFALLVHSYFQQLQAAKASAMDKALARAKIAASVQEFYFKQAEQLLNTVGQFSFLVLGNDYRFATNHLISLKLLSPDYGDFGLIEKDGSLFCDTLGTPPGTKENQEIFKLVKSQKRFAAVIHFGSRTQEGQVACGVPITNSAGEFTRVFYASIKLPVLTSALRGVLAGGSQEVFIFDGQGNQMPARSMEKTPLADKLSGKPLVKTALSGRAWEEDDGLGGRNIFGASEVKVGYTILYYVGIKIPREVFMAAANAGLRQDLILMMASALILLWISRVWATKFLVQPIKVLAHAAGRLKNGDLTARAALGPGRTEINQLSEAFDSMAEALAQRELELKDANKKVAEVNTSLEARVEERTAQLKTINEELEAFSYSVSHDLRAPLRHISGFAEMLQSNPAVRGDEKAKRQLDIIIKAGQQMGNLIDDLLSFSRMAREEMIIASVDMNEMVQQIVSQVKLTAPDRLFQFEISPLPRVTGDPSMLRLVWENLLSNAVKYTRGKNPAEIKISVEQNSDEIIFNIRDNGAGFDMKYASKLFGVFQRLHREEEFEGTGIGLANVRRIVHRHRGRTWAEGKQGEGASVYFSLPTTKQTTNEAVP